MAFQIDPANPIAMTQDLKAVRISEIILQTSRYDEMKMWYQAVLGQDPSFENARPAGKAAVSGDKATRASDVRICFFRLHMDYPYTQTLGLFEIHGLNDAPTRDPGLNHMQLRHESLDHAIRRYEKLLAGGLAPYRTANHGPSTSFYYKDPDGNVVEMSGPNFDTEDAYLGFFRSEAFRRNPSGIEVDAADYVGRYRSGTPMAELVRIPV